MSHSMSLTELGIPALVGTGPVAVDVVPLAAATANRLPHVTVSVYWFPLPDEGGGAFLSAL